jgi:lysophospholipase L1-like esterase
VISDPSSSLNTLIYSLSQPQVSVLTSSASTKTYQMNSILRTGLAASSAQTSTGGSIGSAFYGQIYLLAVYSSVVPQSTIDTSVASLQSTFRIVTNPAAWIVFDGDSITEGLLTTLGVNNPFQLAPQLNHSVWMRNIGISGQNLATSLANETVRVVNAFNPTITKNIVVMGGGEADICNAGASATTVFNNLKIYISNAKAAGYEVVVATLIFDLNVPNGCTDGSTRDVVRQDYNTMVIANASSLGYSVVDYDSIPELQAPQTPGYSADGIHPTSAGYALMAAKLAPVINALLP